ncbi:MAG: P-loop NTPase fold protein, partial [Candidatus Roseilinea sp.]|uniref:P-loop NTPase fold protein n=1 Tax=Candidatus Roseilinea sp. TaxID=2838777 RepID=UPI00404977E0
MSNPKANQLPLLARERQFAISTSEIDASRAPGNTQLTSLTPGESRAAQELLARFDQPGAGGVIGLLGPRSCGKSTLLKAILAPASGRRIRTPDHRKVIGVIVDAGATNSSDGKSAWQQLVLNVLELLASHAMPAERRIVNELRSELLRVVRASARADEDSRLAVAAFAHHFRSAYPRLVMNVFTLSNAVLVVGIDHLDRAPAGQITEWIEAANYFLSAPGCAVVVCADDAALIAKFEQVRPLPSQSDNASAPAGEALLDKWLPQRVMIEVLPPPIVAAPPPRTSQALAIAQQTTDTRHQDIPPACMRIITSALQPDRRLIEAAASNWRTAMQAIIKRAEDGLGNPISSTVIAKLATLQALSPQLFDAGRYNARLLVTLEQQLRNEIQAPHDDDWYSAVNQHWALKSLLTSNPSLSELSLPDLAAALRLTYAGQDAEAYRPAETTVRAPATTVNRAAEGIIATANPSLSEADQLPFSLGLPAWVSAIVAGGVF